MQLPKYRYGGRYFQSDEVFVQSAANDWARASSHVGYYPISVLDLGCGNGRLAYGANPNEISSYLGIDVSAESIKWCQDNITPERPNFTFKHMNVFNARYNPTGGQFDQFPVPTDSLDLVHAYSVFSHMTPDDVVRYAREIYAVLKHNGVFFFTAFAEPDVPLWRENPPGYFAEVYDGPLHCARFNWHYLIGLLAEQRFWLCDYGYASDAGGQSFFCFKALKGL